MGFIELILILLTIMFGISTICDTVHKIISDKCYYTYKMYGDKDSQEDDETDRKEV